MFSIKEWCYIKNFKSLSCDEHGRSWKATNNINGFLIHLHLWAKDHPLEKTCLLYQVDSKGRLFLLSIMHVRQIKTTNDSIRQMRDMGVSRFGRFPSGDGPNRSYVDFPIRRRTRSSKDARTTSAGADENFCLGVLMRLTLKNTRYIIAISSKGMAIRVRDIFLVII